MKRFRNHQDLYVYVSENELLPDFKSGKELVWEQKGITYGDWYGGPNGDSSYELRTKIPASEVRSTIYSSLNVVQ